MQIVHQHRESLAARPVTACARAYTQRLAHPCLRASICAPSAAPMGSDRRPGCERTLRLRASILNTAAQLQPYPLLRVTLADRFGKRIGSRDFEPSEYLGRADAALLPPGEHVDATLRFWTRARTRKDFEIDVCLRGADHAFSAPTDAAAQASHDRRIAQSRSALYACRPMCCWRPWRALPIALFAFCAAVSVRDSLHRRC